MYKCILGWEYIIGDDIILILIGSINHSR